MPFQCLGVDLPSWSSKQKRWCCENLGRGCDAGPALRQTMAGAGRATPSQRPRLATGASPGAGQYIFVQKAEVPGQIDGEHISSLAVQSCIAIGVFMSISVMMVWAWSSTLFPICRRRHYRSLAVDTSELYRT